MLLAIATTHQHNPSIGTVPWGIGYATLLKAYKVYAGPDGTDFASLADCKSVNEIEDELWKLGFMEVTDE